MSDQEGKPIALSIEDLTITLPNGRALLKSANLTVAEGDFVLLVGSSGAGKSTLLNLIAPLEDEDENGPQHEGVVRVAGGSGAQAQNRVGMVFQNLALFDELTAIQNVEFAIDHRSNGATPEPNEASNRLKALNVPTTGRLVTLSGGEKQRVAVARTLAMEPSILLFDEPTTGLDPYRSREVADLIGKTHRESHKTVIVVTHDYVPFLKHDPRLILLDSESATLRELGEAEVAAYFDREPAAEDVGHGEDVTGKPTNAWRRVLLERPGEVVLTLLDCAVAPFGGWKQSGWKLRYLWYYLRMVLVGATAIYVAIAGAMLGFVSTFFGFSQVPYSEVTWPLLTEEYLGGLGYSTYRVLAPLLIAILMACKCGAAIAADVGARRLTNQFPAMRSFGVSPRHYLYGNIVIALALAAPVLTLIAYLANCYASLTAFLIVSEGATPAVFNRNYFGNIWPATRMIPYGTHWVLIKAVTSGLLVAAIAYAIGVKPKASSVDVSRDVGLTIFWASLAVLALHAGYSFVEF